jgi:hypothetical protein
LSTTTRSHRLAGIAGVLFFVVMIARVILAPDEGDTGDAAAVIAVKIHRHATGVLLDDWAGGIAAILFVAFAVGLAGALRDAGARRELHALAVAGATAVLALASMQHALSATLAFSVADLAQPALTRALFDLSTLVEATLHLPIALTLAAASIAALRTGVLARWLANAGIAVATLNAAAAGALAHAGILAAGGPLGVLSLMTLLLWTLLAGRALLRPKAPAGSAGTDAADALARGSRAEPRLVGGQAPAPAATRGRGGTAAATAHAFAHH